MEFKTRHIIKDVTKQLKFKDGEGFSLRYIDAVLSKSDDRKNEDIELIAKIVESSVENTAKILIRDFEGIKKGKQFLIPVGQPKKKKKRLFKR